MCTSTCTQVFMSQHTCGCLRPTVGVSTPFHLTGDRHWPGELAHELPGRFLSLPPLPAVEHWVTDLHSCTWFLYMGSGFQIWVSHTEPPAQLLWQLYLKVSQIRSLLIYIVFHSWAWLTAMSRATFKQENWRVTPFYLISWKLQITYFFKNV